MMRRALSVLSFCGVLASAHAASAHGGLWRADELRVDPTNEQHIVLRGDVWGLIETRDGGASWQWTCSEVVGDDSFKVRRRPFEMLPGGTVLIGSGFKGLFRSQGSSCDFQAADVFKNGANCQPNGCLPYDVTVAAPGSPDALTITSDYLAAASYRNQIWRSTDDGVTWSPVFGTLPGDVTTTSVRRAPSDAATVYVGAGTVTLPQELRLLSSHDAGKTWTSVTLPVTIGPNDLPRTVRLYGVLPADPNVVFVWLDYDAGDPTTPAPDRVLVSTDGGATFTEVFEAKDDLPGFAISPDGTTVFLGSTADGVWAAALADLRAKKADPFHQVNSGSTWSLAFTSQGLLAGREDFAAPDPSQRMSLGLSKDLGKTFERAMIICDVELGVCPAGTAGANLCPGLFVGEKNFQFDQQSGRCAADGGVGGPPDAGVGAGTDGGGTGPHPVGRARAGGGCSVNAALPGRPNGAPMAALVASLALFRWRSGRFRRARGRHSA